MSNRVLMGLTALAEQAVRMGIDYARLGLGWDHPMTRMQYRHAQHASILNPMSRQRAERSQSRMRDILATVAIGELDGEEAVRMLFLWEIGLQPESPPGLKATFQGVMAALEAELLLPLRALNEGQRGMHKTYSGEPVPPAKIAELVQVMGQPASVELLEDLNVDRVFMLALQKTYEQSSPFKVFVGCY